MTSLKENIDMQETLIDKIRSEVSDERCNCSYYEVSKRSTYEERDVTNKAACDISIVLTTEKN